MSDTIEKLKAKLAESDKSMTDLLGKCKDFEAEAAELKKQNGVLYGRARYAGMYKDENVRIQAEVKSLKEFKEDILNSTKSAMDEECKDEKHCTCVPLLRAEVSLLNESKARLLEALKEISDSKSDVEVWGEKYIARRALEKEGVKWDGGKW